MYYSEHEDAYREALGEVYGTVNIAGYEYDAAHALEAVDPVAYRVGMSDYDCGRCEECDPDDDGN